MNARGRMFFLAVILLGVDFFNTYLLDSNREIAQLEAELQSTQLQYEGKLKEIVHAIYNKEVYGTGGSTAAVLSGVDVTYEAVMNSTEDYRGFLEDVDNFFDARSDYLRGVPSIWPVPFDPSLRITSGFGTRISPFTGEITNHAGVDIVGSDNSGSGKKTMPIPILAAADGIVQQHWIYHKDYGKFIILEHPNGFETWYAHLEKTTIHEKQPVKQGQVIGYMGNTGSSQGRHLHYEVHYGGEAKNPIDFLRSVIK